MYRDRERAQPLQREYHRCYHPQKCHIPLHIPYPRWDYRATETAFSFLQCVGNEWDKLVPSQWFFTSEAQASSCPKRTIWRRVFEQNCGKTPYAPSEEKDNGEGKERHRERFNSFNSFNSLSEPITCPLWRIPSFCFLLSSFCSCRKF